MQLESKKLKDQEYFASWIQIESSPMCIVTNLATLSFHIYCNEYSNTCHVRRIEFI